MDTSLENKCGCCECELDRMVDEGETCTICKSYFCIFCWEHSAFDWNTGDQWMCDHCLTSKHSNK